MDENIGRYATYWPWRPSPPRLLSFIGYRTNTGRIGRNATTATNRGGPLRGAGAGAYLTPQPALGHSFSLFIHYNSSFTSYESLPSPNSKYQLILKILLQEHQIRRNQRQLQDPRPKLPFHLNIQDSRYIFLLDFFLVF